MAHYWSLFFPENPSAYGIELLDGRWYLWCTLPSGKKQQIHDRIFGHNGEILHTANGWVSPIEATEALAFFVQQDHVPF